MIQIGQPISDEPIFAILNNGKSGAKTLKHELQPKQGKIINFQLYYAGSLSKKYKPADFRRGTIWEPKAQEVTKPLSHALKLKLYKSLLQFNFSTWHIYTLSRHKKIQSFISPHKQFFRLAWKWNSLKMEEHLTGFPLEVRSSSMCGHVNSSVLRKQLYSTRNQVLSQSPKFLFNLFFFFSFFLGSFCGCGESQNIS